LHHQQIVFCTHVGFDVFEQAARHFKHFGTTLQNPAVGDQRGLGTLDDTVWQWAQAVVLQSLAGRNQVRDDIGIADGRCSFKGAFRGDQGVWDLMQIEKACSQVRKFGCNSQRMPER